MLQHDSFFVAASGAIKEHSVFQRALHMINYINCINNIDDLVDAATILRIIAGQDLAGAVMPAISARGVVIGKKDQVGLIRLHAAGIISQDTLAMLLSLIKT